LRAALPPLRLHSVSLFDKDANVLWLSEGALGPDEHTVVLEAMEALATDTTQTCRENGMEDGRIAIFLPVRAPKGDLVGLSMILADMKSVGDGVIERLVTPQMRTIMQKVAVLLRGAAAKTGETGLVPVLDAGSEGALALVPDTARSVSPPPAAAASSKTPPKAAPARAPTAPVVPIAPAKTAAAQPAGRPSATDKDALTPQAVDDILEFELTPDLPDVNKSASARDSAHATSARDHAPAASAARDHASAREAVPPVVSAAPMAHEPATFAHEDAPVAREAAPISVPTLSPAPAALNESGRHAAVPAVNGAVPPANTSQTASAPHAAPGPSQAAPAAPTVSATGSSKTLSSTGATTASRVLSANDSQLLLEVQQYAKLRAGGRSRRFELQVRTPNRDSSRDSAALDAHALQRLLSWLSINRGAWNLEPTSFTLNLSITTLEDDRFPQNVASALKSHGIAPETIGFEIAEPLCMQRRAQVERFINLCDKIGCFIVIDDFSLDSAVLPLLRSKALRLVKIDPKLTGAALKDKLAQALVVAIAQAVRVLGIHCSAKRVESQGSLQWLTAIGCDFAQGPAISQLQPLEALLAPSAELAKV
jgi:EAL domain-containing protein (putative c-di-GMP-specific phosphodiesterase class I)